MQRLRVVVTLAVALTAVAVVSLIMLQEHYSSVSVSHAAAIYHVIEPAGPGPTRVHTCQHDALDLMHDKHNVPVDPQEYEFTVMAPVMGTGRELLAAENATQPLRIVVDTRWLSADPRMCTTTGQVVQRGVGASACSAPSLVDNCRYTCTDDDLMTASLRASLEDVLIPAAVRMLNATLRVNPVVGNLVVSTGTCGFSGGVTVPAGHNTTGVADADIVLYATARPVYGSVIASAAHCREDANGRPTAGQINYNPAMVSAAAGDTEFQTMISVHEMTHALGFSSTKFSDMRFDNGTVRPESQVLDTVTQTHDGMTNNVTVMITPAVAEAARAHFGCASVAGAEIEDGGGGGTAGSHWEKRVFGEEYMTGTASLRPVMSNLTLAWFYDSGWYGVDWDAAQQLDWGYLFGCDFTNDRCDTWTQDNTVCTQDDLDYCSYNGRSKSTCYITTYSGTIPSYFQYFDDATLGGISAVSDYCPLVVEYSNGDCTNADNGLAVYQSYGEHYGTDGGCFMGSLVKQSEGFTLNNDRVGCYERACASTADLRVRLGDVWYPCPVGQDITAQDFHGALSCPSQDLLDFMCRDAVLDATWPSFAGIDPATGPASGATAVLITGSGFVEGATVTIAGLEATDVSVVSATQIKANTGVSDDLAAASSGWVVVTLPDGRTATSGPDAYAYTALDLIDQLVYYFGLASALAIQYWYVSALLAVLLTLLVLRCLCLRWLHVRADRRAKLMARRGYPPQRGLTSW